MRAVITRTSDITRSPRVLQLEGVFDLPPSKRSALRWDVNIPLEAKSWNIGLIVGPSGSGKTSVAREFFADSMVEYTWPEKASIVDGFPKGMSIKDIVGLLSSVGFSSPPNWLRPFRVLSTGEQFRSNVARALAEEKDLCVIDEFTSVVDRRVAQIGSAAIAKAVRSQKRRLIAVSCHYDIIDWLQPDWILEMPTSSFRWRCLQRFPKIELEIRPTQRTMWEVFRRYHYLSDNIGHARCFAGYINDQPIVFAAVISQPGIKSYWRAHRTVCLPDYQGVGIGNAMNEFIAACYRATGKGYISVTSHPAMIAHRAKSDRWKMRRIPSHVANTIQLMGQKTSWRRLTASFEYVGPVKHEAARRLGII